MKPIGKRIGNANVNIVPRMAARIAEGQRILVDIAVVIIGAGI